MATAAITRLIQSGDSTHHQVQSITPVSFKTIKTTSKSEAVPELLFAVELFDMLLLFNIVII